jgi:hypothetical protein
MKRITIPTLLLTFAVVWLSYATFAPFVHAMWQQVMTGQIRPELQPFLLRIGANTLLRPTVFFSLAGLGTIVGVLSEFLLKRERQRLITHILLLAACAAVSLTLVCLLFVPIWKMGTEEGCQRPSGTRDVLQQTPISGDKQD